MSAEARNVIMNMINALEDCKEDSQQVLDDYKRLYTETYRPERLRAHGRIVADADAAIRSAKKWLEQNP